MKARATASPNIALVKYWGKRDSQLKLPLNDSISVTLAGDFQSRTTVEFSEDYAQDSLLLDGVEASEKEMQNSFLVLDYLRKLAAVDFRASVVSQNTFPKGVGIASSSSGYAALAAAASAALGLKPDARQLSIAARLGSGSASRSIIGGFAHWKAGSMDDGSDSFAVQIADENHWPELRIVTAITSAEPKIIGSTEGMKRTVETSALFRQRLSTIPAKVEGIRQAILGKNMHSLLPAVMAESNSLHAVMLDSWPPIIYLNDTSKRIIAAVHELNDASGEIIAGYTFDAGPNAHILTEQKYLHEVEKAIKGEGVKSLHVSRPGEGSRIL
ncbi:diphosphomevalonate decarboxylase [Candidatus Woesearchaeota archaeon]|nr:diphosphomevalonate decarboxylase [Candidatus Woesearchaeota archaeon]